MSTSLLYHAFGIRGYEYVRTEYQDGEVTFTIRQEPKTFRCEACGSRDVRPSPEFSPGGRHRAALCVIGGIATTIYDTGPRQPDDHRV